MAQMKLQIQWTSAFVPEKQDNQHGRCSHIIKKKIGQIVKYNHYDHQAYSQTVHLDMTMTLTKTL